MNRIWTIIHSSSDRIRRLSPLETEHLMGFPDDYTNVTVGHRSNRTSRYKGTGNSWVVPVIKWLGELNK